MTPVIVTVMQFLLHMLQSYGTKLITVSPTNHKSVLAERGIKSLSNIINETFDWSRVGLGYLLQTCNVCIQQLCFTKFS